MLSPAESQACWTGAGFLAQALFGARFLVQWLYSEARGRSLVPAVFWYLSAIGGAILLGYAIHRSEPVFVAGEATTLLIFLRNLQLLPRRGSRR
ncbi:lipid-A-disaccharide synthase N-terminal domain-containing protein [Rhodanobacter aciditrophus]|uniref:lipid-A-disaccharide synthase N-terminal domain-containing protein n=1 Tax=Rhodanobacter aciditrophus TaxID=1623218 RepID=UPI003CE6FAB6